MVKFKLTTRQQLSADPKFLSNAPKIAEILNTDVRFLSTFFHGEESVLFQMDDYQAIYEKKQALTELGVDCKITPINQSTEPAATAPEENSPDPKDQEKNESTDTGAELELELLDDENYLGKKPKKPKIWKSSVDDLSLDENDPYYDKD